MQCYNQRKSCHYYIKMFNNNNKIDILMILSALLLVDLFKLHCRSLWCPACIVFNVPCMWVFFLNFWIENFCTIKQKEFKYIHVLFELNWTTMLRMDLNFIYDVCGATNRRNVSAWECMGVRASELVILRAFVKLNENMPTCMALFSQIYMIEVN